MGSSEEERQALKLVVNGIERFKEEGLSREETGWSQPSLITHCFTRPATTHHTLLSLVSHHAYRITHHVPRIAHFDKTGGTLCKTPHARSKSHGEVVSRL